MKNVEAVIKYISRALETGNVADLQIAYGIITENERRDAEDVNQLAERAIEIDDFEQDIEFAERQREKELQKINKKRKTSKDLSTGIDNNLQSIPSPRRRIKRKRVIGGNVKPRVR
jgi:hypothetical protein